MAARWAGKRNVVWGIHHAVLAPTHSPRSTIWVAKADALIASITPQYITCRPEKSRQVHAGLGNESAQMRFVANVYDVSIAQLDITVSAALPGKLQPDLTAPVIDPVVRFDPLKDHAILLAARAWFRAKGLQPTCLVLGSRMAKGNNALSAISANERPQDQVRRLSRHVASQRWRMRLICS